MSMRGKNDDQIFVVEGRMHVLTSPGAAITIANMDAISKIKFGICIFRSVLDELFFCKLFGVGVGLVK